MFNYTELHDICMKSTIKDWSYQCINFPKVPAQDIMIRAILDIIMFRVLQNKLQLVPVLRKSQDKQTDKQTNKNNIVAGGRRL